MKSKKVTMIAAALVVAVVALAGIGYATQYTAQTSNDGNVLDSTYIVLQETGTAKYTDILTSVFYNTVNTDVNTTTYTPVYTHSIASDVATEDATTGTYAKISDDLNLSFDMTHTGDATAGLLVTVDHFEKVNGMVYTMLLNDTNDATNNYHGTFNYNSEAHTATWSFPSITLPRDTTIYKVSIFISVEGGGAITPGSGQHIETAGFAYDSTTSVPTTSKLTFVATAGQA